MFLSNWLVFKIVLAAVTGLVDYPLAADVLLVYDNANKLYLDGNSIDYVSNVVLYKGETSYTLGTGDIINKTTTTAYEVVLPSSSVHAAFGINQDATRYVHQYPVASGYQNGKFQVYTGTPSSGYTEYGSPITPFDGNEIINCAMSADGKYILVTNYNGGFADGYKMYKDNGSEYAYHSSYACIGSSTNNDTGYQPVFVPSNNNFVITGTGGGSNESSFYFKLYVYDPVTETWTGKTTVNTPTSATSDKQRGLFGKGFTYDGKYLMMSDNGTPSRGEVYEVDWDANTMTYKWHTTEGSDGDGAGGSISPDNRYVVLARHDGNPYRVYENTSGDWSTVVNVTSEFDLTGSGTGTIFGGYGIGFSGYSSENTTPLYIAQVSFHGDGKFRIENWAKRSPYEMYITQPGTYRADLQICGIDYKTNEVEVTGAPTSSKVTQISTGGLTSLVLTQDGYVYAWGYNLYGQLGQGNTSDENTPVKVKGVGGVGYLGNIIKITTGYYHCMALASDGTLYAWGYNNVGQIGDGTSGTGTNKSTPVVVSYSGDPVSNISAGMQHSALTTTTGKVYCWGSNGNSELGDKTTTNRSTPVQVVGVNNIGNLTGIRDVTCGDSFTHAIKDSDGSVYGWGKRTYGMLGDGTNSGTIDEPVPVILASDSSAVTGIVQVNAGDDHTVMLKSDGTVYACGYGADGEQGDGGTANNDTGLVQVLGVGGSGYLTGITQIATCLSTSLALKSDGTMYVWGSNADGQNGLGTVGGTNPTTPVAITTLTGVNAVAADGKPFHFIASKPDGSVYCWGRGDKGSIGDATNTADQGTPTQVIAGAGPSVDGKFNLFTEPRLTFDNYNKFSILHGLSYTSSKLVYYSNVYDVGTLTDKLFIDKTGEYTSLTFDTSSNVAYFSNATVGAMGTTLADYVVDTTIYGTVQSGQTHQIGQGGFGNNTILNADGTRLLITDPLNYPSGRGRAYIYHLENGSWVLKQTWDNPTNSGQRFADGVCMNEDGTRIFLMHSASEKVYTYEYASGAWPTANTGTHTITPGTIGGEYEGMACNKAGDVLLIGQGNVNTAKIYRRASATSWSQDSGGSFTKGRGVAMNGDGTRAFIGNSTDGTVHMTEWNGSTWSSLTKIIDESYSNWPCTMMSDSAGETLVIVSGNGDSSSGNSGIYERDSGTGLWSRAQGVNADTEIYGMRLPSISYDGTMVLVGSFRYDSSKGRAQLWQKSNGAWTLTKEYLNPDTSPASSDQFGAGCGIARTTKDKFVIGMEGDDTAGTDYGSVYVYSNEIPKYLDFDTYNKLSIQNITPTSTTLKYGSNTYDLGTRTDVYIDKVGTYDAGIKASDKFALVSNVVGTVTQVDAYDYTDTTEQRILGETSDEGFGSSVAIDGTHMIVGTYISQMYTGAAYIYTRNGTSWTQQANIAGEATNDWLGHSVSISGDYAIVGAPGNSSTGAAYIYTRSGTTWTQQEELNGEADYDSFGESVSISGDYAIVGASDNDTAFSGAGAAYIYKRNGTTWTQQENFTGEAANDSFGSSVSISGDYAIVGAYRNDTAFTDAGATYIYIRSGTTWTQQAKLNGEATSDYFGWSVSISGDYAIVGANRKNSSTGAAYIYTRSGTTWTQQKKLTGEATSDSFGQSVSIDGDYAIVGANRKNSYTGAAYIYKRDGTTWTQQTKFTGEATYDEFGTSVSIDDDYAIVGASFNNSYAGTVYIYTAPNIVPKLTHDTYNKLSIENITPTSTTLTDPNGSSFDIGTATDIYIEDTGTYEIETKDANTFALVSNTTGNLGTYLTLHDNVAISHTTGGGDTTVTVNNIKGNMTYKIYFNKQWTDSHAAYNARFGLKIKDSSDVVIRDMNAFADYKNNPRDGLLLYDGGGSFDEGAMTIADGFVTDGGAGSVTVEIDGGTYGSTSSPFTLADSFYVVLTMSTSDVITGKFFVGDTEVVTYFLTNRQSNTGTIGETGNKFEFRFFDTATISGVNMTVEEYNPAPKLNFDTYNKLSISGITPTSTSLRLGSNTFDIGTATDIYIEDTGTYEIETKDVNTFALVSNVVTGNIIDKSYNAVSIVSWTNLGTTLTSDTKNITFSGYTNWNTTGTVSTSFDSTNNAIVFGGGNVGLQADFTSLRSDRNSNLWVEYEVYLTSGDMKSMIGIGKADGGNSDWFNWYDYRVYVRDANTGTGTSGNVPTGQWVKLAWKSDYIGSGDRRVSALLDSGNGYEEIAYHTGAPMNAGSNYLSDTGVLSYIRLFYTDGNGGASTTGNKIRNIHIFYNQSDVPTAPPSLTHDTYNKLSIENITPMASTLRLGSNTYDIGTATDIYIEDTGTYEIETKDANTFALMSNVVTGTLKTIEPMLRGGYENGHALTYDGKLYAWGRNTLGTGELGVGDASNRSVPTLCTGITQGQVAKFLDTDGNAPKKMAWIKTTDNKIHVTGNASQNQIPGHTSDLNTFTDVTSHFGDQSLSSNNIIQICFGGYACAGLTESGNVWTWGQNDSARGNLGNGGTTSSTQAVPAQITFNGATDNIIKLANGHDFTIALDNESNVWLWGTEWLGNTWGSASPIKMGTALDSITVTDIAASYSSMYAISNTGVLYASGNGGGGQIMDGLQTSVTSSSNPDWKEVTYFSSNNITVNKVYPGTQYVSGGFVDTSDGWYAFGGNSTGNLGLGDITDKLSPVKFTGVSNIKKFAVGYSTSHAVTEDGKYYAWGSGANYARGDNDTGAISYPKYIDTLPNILAPSFEFDGYDKVFVKLGYEEPPSLSSPRAIGDWINCLGNPFTFDGTTYTLLRTGGSMKYTSDISTGAVWTYCNSPGGENPTSDTVKRIAGGTWEKGPTGNRPSVNNNIVEIDNVIFIKHGSPIEPTYAFNDPYDVTPPSISEDNVKFSKNAIEYDANQAQIVTVSDPGTYDAQLAQGGVFSLKSTTIPSSSSSGLYTWAFHHGNFDNAYGDGDILTARDNGRFYADTPSYTGDIGTITANPNINSYTYTVSFKVINQSGTTIYDGTDGSIQFTMTEGVEYDTRNDLSTALDDAIDTALSGGPSEWSVHGFRITSSTGFICNHAGTSYDTHTYTLGTLKTFHSRNGGSVNVLITNPYYSQTTYTFTPASTLTANVLMVAGGGGGGGNHGGGGGAGGLVYTAGTSLAQGTTKTIVVGNGSSGGVQTGATLNGNDTTFTGLTTADGGGGGGGGQYSGAASSIGYAGGDGGSGGGGTSGSHPKTGGSGTVNQGNSGGSGDGGGRGGGGGGAGSAGESGNTNGNNGGTGLNYSITFGTFYGDSGWFASGGGGGGNAIGDTFKGGGGSGATTEGKPGTSAIKHTGGGGGGGGKNNNSGNIGGTGGSGIVLLQTNVATPKVNSEVKVPEPDGFLVYNDNLDLVSRGPIANDIYTSNTVKTVKLPDGSEGPVFYNSDIYTYFSVGQSNTNQGDGSFQTIESVFMPIETGNYTHIASLMYNDANLMTLGIDGNNKLIIQHNNNVSHNAVTTLTTSDYVMEHGKWHHLVLTTDYLGNAKAYVNGYLVASERWSSMNADKSTAMFYRIGVDNHAERKYMASTSRCYYSELNKKEIMQLAESVGLGPKLEYDGLNTINVVNTEPGSGTEITIYESNVNDTSNLYVVSCIESSYLLSNAGTYYAQIKGTDTFTITRPLTITDDHFPLYQYPPVATGTLSNGTFNTSAGSGNQSYFTVSGAETGNGTYSSYSSVAAASPGGIPADSSSVFTNIINASTITYTNEHYNFFQTSSLSNIDLVVIFPSAKTIRKYVLYPKDDNAPTSPYEPGSSVNPMLEGNGSQDYLRRPKSWTLYGYTESTGWVSLDTVTNQPPSIYGDVHSISSPASYDQYKLSISENNGSTQATLLGEWQLWGDA